MYWWANYIIFYEANVQICLFLNFIVYLLVIELHTHTLWIPVICLIYTLWIFLLNLWIFFFYFLNSVFQELKFLIWWNKIVIFPFVSYVLCPKKCLSTSRLWIFTYVFFPKFKTSVYMSYPFQVNLVHSMR